MSRAIPLPLMLLIVVTLAGCGGGGGGSGGGGGGGGGSNVTGISLSPSTMSFTANHDDPDAPPAQTVTITALGSGTTYIRFENGTATGLTCNGTSSCTFPVRPTSAPSSFVSPNTTTDAITFVGCADQTCTTGPVANGRQTLTYTYAITPGLDVSPSSALMVNGIEGVPAPPQTLTLTHPSGTVPPWHAMFTPTGPGPSFVTLSPTSAATAGTTTLQAQFSGLPVGTYTGTIDVSPGTSPRRVKRDVIYNVQSALSVTGTTSFVVDASTLSAALQQTLTVTSAPGAGVLSWTATDNAPWLELLRMSGDTSAANQMGISLARAQIERLPKGIYAADITFAPSVPAAFATVVVHVSLDMRLPGTEFVMPNAVGVGTTAETFIRGSGFNTLPGTVKFGSEPVTAPTRDSDTLIRANSPATLMAPVSYKVDLAIPPNALGLIRERARLAVVDTAALITQSADVPVSTGPKYAAVFDDARLTLYLANTGTGAIERLQLLSGSWNWDAYPVPFLSDIAMSPGGDEMLALTWTTLVRLNPDIWGAIIDTVDVPSPGGLANSSFAGGNDSRVLISQAANGGVSTNIAYYDLHAAAFSDEFVCCISGNIRASGDGAAIYLLGDTNIRRYDVKTRTYTNNGAAPLSTTGKAVSVARAGARFVVDGTHVYNGDLSPRGTLSVSGESLKAAAITADGARAYAYGTDGISSSTLHKFDLEVFSGPGAFAEIGTGVPLPHMVSSPVMTTSVDGRTVFIAGDDRVIVRPVPP